MKLHISWIFRRGENLRIIYNINLIGIGFQDLMKINFINSSKIYLDLFMKTSKMMVSITMKSESMSLNSQKVYKHYRSNIVQQQTKSLKQSPLEEEHQK